MDWKTRCSDVNSFKTDVEIQHNSNQNTTRISFGIQIDYLIIKFVYNGKGLNKFILENKSK